MTHCIYCNIVSIRTIVSLIKNTNKKLQKKIRKFNETGSNLINELLEGQLLILEYIEKNNRTSKFDNFCLQLSKCFEKAINIYEQLNNF